MSSCRATNAKWLYFGEKYGHGLTFGTQRDDCRECARRYAKLRGVEELKP